MKQNNELLGNTTENIPNTTVSSVDTTKCRGILTDSEKVVKYLCSV